MTIMNVLSLFGGLGLFLFGMQLMGEALEKAAGTRLKKLLEEFEEPLDRFDEKLFTEIVQAISISRRDEMTVTLIGGLRFTEML